MTDLLEPPEAPSAPQRSLANIWGETAIVLLICVAPLVLQSIGYQLMAQTTAMPFGYLSAYLIVRAAGAIGLIWLLIARSGEPFTKFGLDRPRLSDIASAVLLLVVSYVAIYAFWIVLTAVVGRQNAADLAHQNLSVFAPPRGPWAIVLLVIMSIFNGIAEELTVRAYLIPRFEELFGNTALAVLITTLLFASYHSYQGSGNLLSIAVIGLCSGIAFAKFRRFWPVAGAHVLQDILGFAILAMR